MDEILEVGTRVKALGGASVTLIQTITRVDRGVRPLADNIPDSMTSDARGLTPEYRVARLFEADVTVVLVSVSGKPLRLSTAVRSAFGGGEAR
jgi:acyl-CoA thioester hydrolase